MLARSDHDFVLEERRPRRGAGKRGTRRWTAVFSTLFRNPGRTIVGATAAAVGVGILVNALALQGGPHPAPLFRPAPAARPAPTPAPAQATPLPPVRPVEKAAAPSAPAPAASASASVAAEPASAGVPLPPRIQRSAAPAPAASAPAAGIPIPPAPIPTAPRDAIGDILKGGAPAATTAAPAAPVEPDRTVLAVQRALNKLNYGPVKPDGLMGPGTRQAIERFERERRLPVTGEATGRTARELATASGIPVD